VSQIKGARRNDFSCLARIAFHRAVPYVLDRELMAAYQEMAQDAVREGEALEWAEATVGDVIHEKR
jgi:hypothetical protein